MSGFDRVWAAQMSRPDAVIPLDTGAVEIDRRSLRKLVECTIKLDALAPTLDCREQLERSAAVERAKKAQGTP